MWMHFRSLSEEIQEKGRKNRQVYFVWKVVKNSENNVDETVSSLGISKRQLVTSKLNSLGDSSIRLVTSKLDVPTSQRPCTGSNSVQA